MYASSRWSLVKHGKTEMVSSTEDTTAVCWQGTLKMKRDQASITSPVPPQSETVFTQGNCSEASVCGIAWNLEKIRQQKQCKKKKQETYSIFWIQCSCPTKSYYPPESWILQPWSHIPSANHEHRCLPHRLSQSTLQGNLQPAGITAMDGHGPGES